MDKSQAEIDARLAEILSAANADAQSEISVEMSREVHEFVKEIFPEPEAAGEHTSLGDLAQQIINNTREGSLTTSEIAALLRPMAEKDPGGKILKFPMPDRKNSVE